MPSEPERYPLTFEQESIWLDENLHQQPVRYLESWAYRLTGTINLPMLEAALADVVLRHDALHSGIDIVDGDLVQTVLPVPAPLITVSECYTGDPYCELRNLIRTPLNLAESPMRGHLIRLAPTEAILAVQLHHIVIDDWALHALDHDFAEAYRARAEFRPADLPPLPLQLGPFALSQREAGLDPEVLRYWLAYLHDVPSPGTVPGIRPRPHAPSWHGDEISFTIDRRLAGHVRATCRQLRTTPFTIFAGAIAILVAAASGTDDVLIGAPVSRRGPADLDPLIGCITDLLPLRIPVPAASSFTDLVGSSKSVVSGAIAHSGISYAELSRRVLSRQRRRTEPLCRTILVVDDTGPGSLELPGVRAERLHVHTGTAKFDLCFTLVADAGGYQGFLEYATDLFDAKAAEHIAGCLVLILGLAAEQPGALLTDIMATVREWQAQPRSGSELSC